MSELNEQLLDIARRTGLRAFLHGVNATDARELLGAFVAELDKQRATPAPQAAPSEHIAALRAFLKRCSNGGMSTEHVKIVGDTIDAAEQCGYFKAPAPAVTQAAPSDKLMRHALHIAEQVKRLGWDENGDEGAWEFVTRTSYETGWNDRKGEAAPSVQEAKDAVCAAALAWWEGHRPLECYSEAEHIENPAVNCAGFTEDVLARAVAAMQSAAAPSTAATERDQ